MVTERRKARIERVLKFRQPDLTVIFENIHDPHNVSAILRTCDAAGVLETFQIYTDTPFPKLGEKSSSSARKWIKQNKFRSYQELRGFLKDKGFIIYATSLQPDSIPFWEVDWKKPSAIIFGNEHAGVSAKALAISDERIIIPQFGMVESLNVSVSAAIILYEAVRQRLQAGFYQKTRLDEILFNSLLNQWLNK